MTSQVLNSDSHYGRGIALIVGAVGCYAAMTASVKYLSADYSVFQIIFFRNLIALPIILAVLTSSGGIAGLRTRRPGLQLVRNATWILGNICLFASLPELALADVSAIQFTAPLMVTAMSSLLLKDHVGLRRWSAVVAGFAGVLIVVPPTGEVKLASIVVLFAAFCYASTVVMTRVLSAADSTGVILFYLALVGTLTGAVALPWVWVTPTPTDLVILLMVGGFGGLAQLGLVAALRVTPPSVLAPFDYTTMLWAVGFDLLLWQTAPTFRTVVGAGVIAAAGLYVAHRESSLAKV